VRSARAARRTAWYVAGCACGIAALATFAVASLAPLHSVEFRAIRVDSATGVIEDAQVLRDAPKSFTEVEDRFMLATYVRQREGYASPEAQYDFHAVSLLSSKDEQSRYADLFRGSNPLSPQNVYGKNGYMRVVIESVAVLNKGRLGQVRFRREEQHDGGGAPHTSHLLATVGYEWHPEAAISNADRTINPFGWITTDYHVDADTPQ
jgi:type IV secretion system protein VirB8